MLRAVMTSVCVVAAFLAASNSFAQQPGGNPRTTEKSAITGRVISSTGEPLPGASVTVAAYTPDTRSKEATVDKDGDFKVDGLVPGLYSIYASLPGYIAVAAPNRNDSPNYYRIGDSVTLTLSKGGVITGRVTGPNGPVVGVSVLASRVRDADGKKIPPAGGRERRTDDRGMFRIYGLSPGSYILSTSRPRLGTIVPSAYDNDVTTYYPSATRDTAAEIVLREGDEITADIQYRGETGHAISGKITGVIETERPFSSSTTITLTDVQTHLPVTSGSSFPDPSVFAIYGLADGEYELVARQYLAARDELRSPPQRVTVRGGDVTGITLNLAPTGAIEGRLVFESDPKDSCAKRKDTAAVETLVFARRYETEKKARDDKNPAVAISAVNYSNLAVGDARGSFTLRSLPPGPYILEARPPASGWFLRSVTSPTKPNNTGRDGISIKGNEHVKGLVVTLAEGASVLRGRVSAGEGKSLPAGLRIYLTPADRENAGNLYRFYETGADGDGSFTFDNLAPGRYWVVARRAEENDLGTVKAIRLDEALRSKVVREAEALKKAVTLKSCEQVANFAISFPR